MMTVHDLREGSRKEITGAFARVLGLGCGVLLLASCAGTPVDQTALQDADTTDLASTEVLICEEVATTGTRFARRVCWTEEQREGQRDAAGRLTGEIRD